LQHDWLLIWPIIYDSLRHFQGNRVSATVWPISSSHIPTNRAHIGFWWENLLRTRWFQRPWLSLWEVYVIVKR